MRAWQNTWPFFWSLILILAGIARGVPWAIAEDAVELSPLLKEGSPVDALNEDPMVPAAGRDPQIVSGSGSIIGSFENQLALPLNNAGRPGTNASFLGLGRRAEDTNVQTLGIPLNPAQGGGFGFDSFPQYFWSGYRFQPGPPSASVDPRATAGTLTLIPWTLPALSRPGVRTRLTQYYSNQGLVQTSIGAGVDQKVAILMGYSEGDVQGPSASLSGRWGRDRIQGKFHLLATRVESRVPGPTRTPTPNAEQLTARLIPVFQTDFEISPKLLLKASAFYDGQYLRYEDPGALSIRDQMRQGGIETAWLWQSWKFGLHYRRASFHGLDFQAPDETTINAQVSRLIEWDSHLLEPNFQAIQVTGYGWFPAGSLGYRYGWSPSLSSFARMGYNRKIPSLLDRYYGIFGNPELQPEETWSGILGTELDNPSWGASLQFYGRIQRDAIVADVNYVPQNLGNARILSLIQSLRVTPISGADLVQSTHLSTSRISGTGQAFPYLPGVTELLSATIYRPGTPVEDRVWQFSTIWRFEGPAAYPSGARRPGFGSWDMAARGRVAQRVRDEDVQNVFLTAKVENILDREVERVSGYVDPGRVFSLALIGEF